MNSSIICNNEDVKSFIVAYSEVVTLLGAAPIGPHRIQSVFDLAPNLIAADGGASLALAAGLVPDWIIGDLDSVDVAALSSVPHERILHVEEQNSTDFEKALRHIEAPLILAVGFSGGRVDHELAVYNALVRHESSPVIVLTDEDIVFQAPRSISLDLPVGSRVSLFPMGPVLGRSTGLKWPIEGLEFRPGGSIGTSNQVTGPVELSFESDQMLIILPRDALFEVMSHFGVAPRVRGK
ncbi:MAG: thiamine diphosphokinase [Pseudoruegeria sp.]